jgi:hypothetical protein
MSITRRRLIIGAATIAALFLATVVGLWLGVPAAVRWGLETVAAREIGRPIRVGDIRFNPFTLRLALRDLTVAGGPGESAPMLTLGELHAQASARSIWRLAPILRSLRLQTLRANIIRLAPNRFTFSDIVERLMARPDTDEPPRFAVYNIELADGAVALDDRFVGKRNAITDITVGIPFISSLPDHDDVHVKPQLSAKVNGTPFELEGQTLPFADSLETSVAIRFSGLDLPMYLAYVPLPLQFSLPRGALDTDLRLVFRRAVEARDDRPAQPPQLLLSGRATVRDLAVLPNDMKEPLVEWRSLEVVLDEARLLARSARVASVTLAAPVLRAQRLGDGSLAGLKAFDLPQPAGAADARQAAGSARPFEVAVAQLRLTDGTVHVRDDTVGFGRTLQPVAVEIDGLTNVGEAPARLSVNARTDDGAQLKATGELRAVPLRLAVDAAAESLPLAGLAPYLRAFTVASAEGTVNAGARVSALQDGGNIGLAVTDGNATIGALRVRGPRGSTAQLSAPQLEVSGASLDLQQRSIAVERVKVGGARVQATRDADGRLDWLALLVDAPPSAVGATASQDPAWNVTIGEVQVVSARATATDETVQPPVKLAVEGLNASVRNAGSDLRQRMQVTVSARLGGGTAQARGWLRPQPLATELKLEVANVDVGALRPYVARHANFTLASAAVWADGLLVLSMSDELPVLRYEGTARVTNLAALNADSETELARWQALALDAVRVDTGVQPPSVDIGAVKLNDFYARAILSEEGRLNLVDVFRGPAVAAAPDTPAEAKPAGAGKLKLSSIAERFSATAAALPARIRIGGIELLRGNVNFTDNFVKPNYTANLTDLAGTISELSSERAVLADVSVRGRVDRDAPVEITGKVNPLAAPLALDLRGSTKGVELPRLTPYSVKYAGYPITRGKLSMDVHYQVEDNKLKAENHLFLDQLTFGERVESPTATKLPVLLAVSLLKNSRGEIDIRLPVSGSLDDPEFSIGGIILQVIVNLLTKVVTAPFSVLASAFGGDADLGHVEFAAGSALIAEAEARKLETLAKALNDRPALKLDMTGRALAGADTDALRRAGFDAKLRAAKVREIVRGGGSIDPATVTIAPEERERLIGRVYADEKIPDKPRNFLGIARTIPAAEMEKLILATITVTEEDLRGLANDRATAVRDHLSQQGKVPRERLFLVAPLLDGSGDAKLPPTRVDFSLK